MIRLANCTSGCLIEVHAHPGAKRSAVVGEHDGSLRVSVTEVADKGKANQAVAKVLAEFFGIARSSVQLQSGHTSRKKRFLLCDVNAEEIVALLASRLG